jgi:hypothetical protein
MTACRRCAYWFEFPLNRPPGPRVSERGGRVAGGRERESEKSYESGRVFMPICTQKPSHSSRQNSPRLLHPSEGFLALA